MVQETQDNHMPTQPRQGSDQPRQQQQQQAEEGSQAPQSQSEAAAPRVERRPGPQQPPNATHITDWASI